jgi:hypothetical protein
MLEKSDTSISDALKAFNAFDLEVGLIVPTKTGMEKSIMDATASLRDYLRDNGFHDYDTQGQGNAEHGVKRKAYFVRPDTLDETEASLYRPVTKNGDPRIWFGKLKRYANPFNLLAIIVDAGELYIVNCSEKSVMASLHDPSSPLGILVARRRPAIDPAVVELLDMIQEISRKGFVPTLRAGDTGIGMTLETMLGIAANANKAPDYKGIEIKAKRLRKVRNTRYTLFSQVPDWKLSPRSAWEVLRDYGYKRDGRLQLYHQLDASKPNSRGLLLNVDAGQDWLRQDHVDKLSGATSHLFTWQLETLRERLRDKHRQTFWVDARVRGKGQLEEFHYVQVRHTRGPKVRNFDALLEGGVISLDLTLKQVGKRDVAKDHGYLFKINPRDFDALFPPAEVHVFA